MDEPSNDRPWQVPPTWDAAAPVPGRTRHIPVRPSPIFLGLVALMVGAGIYVWTQGNHITRPGRVGIFAFVAVGWIVSLCLHEFDHAAMAWWGGDHSVEGRGYLTLDPRNYMHGQLSIVLPIIIVLLGGIGLPGGAVMTDQRFIPSRARRSLISAAGPLTNAVCAVLCAIPIKLHWIGSHHQMFASALAFLAFLEVAATVLNSLPIPGFDGFGVIAPFLSAETVASLMPISRYAFLGLFLLLFSSARAGSAFYNFLFRELAHLGVDRGLAESGQLLFTFWRSVQ
jgi:Zn-dependent protease